MVARTARLSNPQFYFGIVFFRQAIRQERRRPCERNTALVSMCRAVMNFICRSMKLESCRRVRQDRRQPQSDCPALNEYGAPYNALTGEVRAAIADLPPSSMKSKKVGDAVGQHSHINSKNADYGAAEQYSLLSMTSFTMKPVLDETGRLIPARITGCPR